MDFKNTPEELLKLFKEEQRKRRDEIRKRGEQVADSLQEAFNRFQRDPFIQLFRDPESKKIVLYLFKPVILNPKMEGEVDFIGDLEMGELMGIRFYFIKEYFPEEKGGLINSLAKAVSLHERENKEEGYKLVEFSQGGRRKAFFLSVNGERDAFIDEIEKSLIILFFETSNLKARIKRITNFLEFLYKLT